MLLQTLPLLTISKHNRPPNLYVVPRIQTIVTRPVYDGFLFTVCSIAGSRPLLAVSLFNTLPNIHDISGGTSAFLVFPLRAWPAGASVDSYPRCFSRASSDVTFRDGGRMTPAEEAEIHRPVDPRLEIAAIAQRWHFQRTVQSRAPSAYSNAS